MKGRHPGESKPSGSDSTGAVQGVPEGSSQSLMEIRDASTRGLKELIEYGHCFHNEVCQILSWTKVLGLRLVQGWEKDKKISLKE